MRKRMMAIAAIAVSAAMLLTACGLQRPRNGTYQSDEGVLSQSLTFSGADEITVSAGGLVSMRGTYSIEGNKLTVMLDVFGLETTTTHTITEIKPETFFYDGIQYTKQ